MQNITSFQLFGTIILSFIGFAFRLSLHYKNSNTWPKFSMIISMFIFSMGTAGLTFLYTFEKDWAVSIKLLYIWFGSFFGTTIVSALDNLDVKFFTGIAKEIVLKIFNIKDNKNGEQSSDESDGEVQETTEMSEDEENRS